MLEGLFVTPAATAIREALAGCEGKLAVIGNAKLASALAEGREVVAVGIPARAAKSLPGTLDDLSSVADRSLAAVVAIDARDVDEWLRVVRDGGRLVLVDRGTGRGHAAGASTVALCAGLIEIEQRHIGRVVVTSGIVKHL